MFPELEGPNRDTDLEINKFRKSGATVYSQPLQERAFKFITMLSETEKNFDDRIQLATITSINDEYDQLVDLSSRVLGEDDSIKLDIHRDHVTLKEILQSYKDILKYMDRKAHHTNKKGKKYYRQRGLTRFNEEEINPILQSLYNPPAEGILNENTVLHIWCDKSQDRKFLDDVSNMNFPPLKTLSLTSVYKIKSKKSIISFNKFLAHSITKNMSYLHISGDKKGWGGTSPVDIKRLFPGICPVLNLALTQIHLGGILLNGPELK